MSRSHNAIMDIPTDTGRLNHGMLVSLDSDLKYDKVENVANCICR